MRIIKLNAKELILGQINCGSKLAKMYLFLITMGYNINDIVSFMTSPVARFVYELTEENIYSGQEQITLENAVKQARSETKLYDEDGKPISLYNFQTQALKERLGLTTMDKAELQADCNEFLNVLQAANEFSNLGRLYGFNQGIPTNKVDLQAKVIQLKNILATAKKNALKDSSKTTSELEAINNIKDLDVKRWTIDEDYREKIAREYDLVKKCVNVFDAFTKIPQFDAIRKLFSTVLEVDDNISFKSKAFDVVYSEMSQQFSYIPEQYQARVLTSIDKIICNNFILSKNISFPVSKGTKYLDINGRVNTFEKDGLLNLNSKANIGSFKYIFENKIIPELKQGKVTKVDKDGNIITEQVKGLSQNPFIAALIKAIEKDIPFYKVSLNMQTIEDSSESQKKFQNYKKGIGDLNKIYITDNMTLADAFVLYNIIINRNQYGKNRITSLFNSYLRDIPMLRNFFDYEANLDWYGVPILEGTKDVKLESNQIPLYFNYQDVLIDSARIVRSTSGNQDPCIIKLESNSIPVIVMKGKNDESFIIQEPGESENDLFERVNNIRRYFVLGSKYSDYFENIINTIKQSLETNASEEDIEKIISYFKQFLKEGTITQINKICK